MSISLRAATLKDQEFLFTVYSSTRADELAQTAWADEQKEIFLRAQFDAQSRHYAENYPGAQFQVIELDGLQAGRLYVHRRQNEIRIMDIALLPEYRNRGVGSSLLKEILKEGGNKNLSVTIHVERFNPARLLYERLGFRLLEDKGIYMLMEWSLAEAEAGRHAG